MPTKSIALVDFRCNRKYKLVDRVDIMRASRLSTLLILKSVSYQQFLGPSACQNVSESKAV
jgi:hypothetical protein